MCSSTKYIESSNINSSCIFYRTLCWHKQVTYKRDAHSPAVDNYGGGDFLGVASDVCEEVESRLSGCRHSVIWPGSEPEMSHLT